MTLGIWLQDRERSKTEAGDLGYQVIALIAIAERCIKTLERLSERAHNGTFTRAILPWLGDEAKATAETVGSIDLMAIKSATLIHHVAELQEAGRTGLRRFNYAADHVRKDEKYTPNDFDDPLNRANKALAGIKSTVIKSENS